MRISNIYACVTLINRKIAVVIQKWHTTDMFKIREDVA